MMYRVVDLSSIVHVNDRRLFYTKKLMNAKINAIDHFLHGHERDKKYEFKPATVVKDSDNAEFFFNRSLMFIIAEIDSTYRNKIKGEVEKPMEAKKIAVECFNKTDTWWIFVYHDPDYHSDEETLFRIRKK